MRDLRSRGALFGGLGALGRCLPFVVLLALLAAMAHAATVEVGLDTDRRGRPVIVAQALDDEGKPLTRRTVEFYLLAEFLPNEGDRLTGSHPVYMGSGTTDVVGKASTSYTPPFTGLAVFEARIFDEDGREEARGQVRTQIVREASLVPTVASRPLDGVRTPLGFSILALGVITWLFLLALALGTIRKIARLGKEVEYEATLFGQGLGHGDESWSGQRRSASRGDG